MSENTQNTQVAPVSTEVPEVSVKSVLDGLSGDARMERGKSEMSGSFGTRESSGFDRLSVGDRTRVRNGWNARIKAMVRDAHFGMVQAAMDVADTLSGTSRTSGSSEVTEESVRSVIGTRVAMLRYAADALFAGSVPIAGYAGLVPILEESDIPDLTDEQCETALNRYGSVGTGTKRKENDIPDMLRETLGSLDSGTFYTISAIRNKMAEIYPNKGISATWDGRLNASLFGPNWDESDGTPVESTRPLAHAFDSHGRAGVVTPDATE